MTGHRSPRRVAFILGCDGVGGTELQAKLLVRQLRLRGVCVDVFVVEGSAWARDFGGARVTSLAAPRGGRLSGLFGMFRAWRLLRHELGRGHYDVVHAAMARAYVLAPLAAPLRRRPLVVAWRRNEGIHLRPHTLAAAIEWVAGRLSDVAICNSTAVRDYWCARGHIRRGTTKVITNAIDPSRFERVEAVRRLPGSVRLVSLGSLKPVKDQLSLLKAAARLASSGANVEVALVGEGPLREQLAEYATQSGITLLLPGRVADPRPWLASADIYVHPSLSEGSSNAILESMAQGLPVIATRVGGTAELLGEAGMLVGSRDLDGLVQAIQTLIADPARAGRLGDQARERAGELFGVSRVVDAHLDVYGFTNE